MPTKRIFCNFFRINEPEGLEGKVDELLHNQHELIKSNLVENVGVSDFILRFTFLEKQGSGENYWWVGIIERLDLSQQGEISNLKGEKTVYGTKEDEGPIINTGFVYHPLTQTFCLHRKIGGVNDVRLGVFIRKILKQAEIISSKSSKFKLDVLPDLDKLGRLSKASNIKKLEYSFVMPENISSKEAKSRPILGDLFLANELGGERMKVTIQAHEMNLNGTIRKVREILGFDRDKLGALKVITEHNDIEEPLDLLTDKFNDFLDVSLKRGQKETVILIMDTVNKIFMNQKTLIQKMYLNDEEE